jgi:uncharacterized SAM-binding protein YcdF (DUF218 family)
VQPPPAPDPVRRWRRSLWGEAWRWLLTGIIFVLVAGMTIMVGLVLAVYWQARTDQVRPVDAIVVMGTAQHNGRPGPVLQARLDRALALYEAGNAPLLVVTGGRAPGDQFTEAEAGETFLLAEGVPPAAIVKENAGRDTWQSMMGVAEVLAPRDVQSVLLVSDGFHLLRSKLMARDLGFEPYGSAAVESPIVIGGAGELSFAIREAVAIVAHVLTGR